MITGKDDRMLELLWLVGYCVEFPTQLAVRIGGHPEWNRHVMYRAIDMGYVDSARGRSRQRIIDAVCDRYASKKRLPFWKPLF